MTGDGGGGAARHHTEEEDELEQVQTLSDINGEEVKVKFTSDL